MRILIISRRVASGTDDQTAGRRQRHLLLHRPSSDVAHRYDQQERNDCEGQEAQGRESTAKATAV